MKRFTSKTAVITVCSMMSATPVLAGPTSAIANDPSGVFVEFVTTASGGSATTAVNADTVKTTKVSSTTTTNEIAAIVTLLSLNLTISPQQVLTTINEIDALPPGQVPSSVRALQTKLIQSLE